MVLTMKKGDVFIVEKTLLPINTQKPKSVESAVPIDYELIGIKSITPIGYEDVYNMEVEDFHNFAIEDGLIVHNCIDAFRYACESIGESTFSF